MLSDDFGGTVFMSPAEAQPPLAILVVEDDDDTRDALGMLLRGQNYRVVKARNGREAAQVLLRTRPALIIMDLSMPVMTGWQLLELIRDRGLVPGVPIIVLSADDTSPGDDVFFLQKPVGAELLLEEVRALVSHP
jgi:CheY-like chemotaxis protein